MAISGHNSDNETMIGLSSSIELSFYDEKINEIKISQSLLPIDIVIQRDIVALKHYSFSYVNATSLGFLANAYFLQNSFKIKMTNVSLHIELKPLNMGIAYVLVLKLGYMPIVNSTNADFTKFQIFCPCNCFI